MKGIRKSFGTQMILYLTALIIVVSGGLSAAAYLLAQNSLLDEVNQSLELLSEADAHWLHSLMELQLVVLEEVAYRPELRSLDIDQQLASMAGDVERLGFMDMAIVGTDGTARYVHSDPANLGDRAYVQLARQGQSNISDILVSRVTGSLVVMYAVPIRVNGRVEQVLIARADATAIQNLVGDMGFGDSGYAFVLGNQGTIMAHPNMEYVMDQRNVLDSADATFSDMRSALNALPSWEGVIRYNMDGETRLVGLYPVPGTQWTLGVGAAEDAVLAGLYQMRRLLMVAVVAFILLGIAAAWFISRKITVPVTQAADTAQRLADGDLREDTGVTMKPREDEIGRLLASMVALRQNLHDIIGGMNNQVQAAAETSQNLSASSEENSATIEEVASSVNEFARHLQEVNGYTQQLQQGATTMDALTREGTSQMAVTRSSYEKIVDSSQGSKKEIENVVTLTNNIEQIIGLISGIAEQTNLLALNAAIEAARAGESGRGFAVVADEVRSLAEETQRSIDSVRTTMEQLRKGVSQAAAAMDQTTGAVQDGISSMDAIAEFLEKTAAEIHQEVEWIEKVSGSMTELDQGSQELSSAAEEQAASMAEVANAAETMASLAKDLEQAAARFRL